jgi:hypothetical protein
MPMTTRLRHSRPREWCRKDRASAGVTARSHAPFSHQATPRRPGQSSRASPPSRCHLAATVPGLEQRSDDGNRRGNGGPNWLLARQCQTRIGPGAVLDTFVRAAQDRVACGKFSSAADPQPGATRGAAENRHGNSVGASHRAVTSPRTSPANRREPRRGTRAGELLERVSPSQRAP